MASKVHIAVITHAIDRFENRGYTLNALVEYWKADGISVEVSRGPVDQPPEADLAFSHVDMTAVADEYARMFSCYPLVINGAVRDISKTTFSRQIISRDDAWQGPVIVKTDRNFGGFRELRERQLSGDASATMDIRRPWRKLEVLPAYPVFDTAAHVPPGVWRNANLVVEKFRPERHGADEFALRMWKFLGDRGIYSQSFSKEPIIKGRNTTHRIVFDQEEVPQGIQEIRRRLGFDYGKFDFGVVDGEPVLYDVNRTPGLPPPGTQSEKIEEQYPSLARGLDYFLRKLNGFKQP